MVKAYEKQFPITVCFLEERVPKIEKDRKTKVITFNSFLPDGKNVSSFVTYFKYFILICFQVIKKSLLSKKGKAK